MSNVGISNTNTSQIDANVLMPGPTGVAGDMKKNPAANPNITQNDVSSTQHASREIGDVTRPGTKAFENAQDAMKKSYEYVDPEQQKLDSSVLRTVITHSNGTNLHTNPSASAEYGK
ncbi:MAG: hypothetical protein LBQ23_00205 [Puniceicoccales bacterium]|jgi:hypothetical protein|nr:hypothetical protein [Puniceicoccales bacterium]